jgi:pimeloyl-ACP methyl ester carboxylesterase
MRMSPHTGFLAANGGSFEVFEQGTGAPVVFVHGAPSDYRTWIPHCRALAGGFRAISYSQRYFGTVPWGSDWPPFSMRVHSDDLIALLQALGAGPAHVVAWSYGGHIALTAAVERPELFRSLFVYEPGTPTYVSDASDLAAIAHDASRMFGPVFAAVQAGDSETAVRVLLDGSGERAGYFDSQPAERRTIQLENARVMSLLLSQPAPPALSCAQLAALQMPVAIRWGERTRPFFGVVSRAAARCIGGPHHGAIAGAAHMWPEEDPAGFTREIERLIKRA